MKKHTAPIIAAVLLLLPVLYVGSYFALVLPQGRFVNVTPGIMNEGREYHFRIPRRVVNRRSECVLALRANRPEGETGSVETKASQSFR
jgi:hypothetical protein